MEKQFIGNRRANETSIWYDRWPFNPRWPNGYRGDTGAQLRIGKRIVRVQWSFKYVENDWPHVDNARMINFSPYYAKGFSFFVYGASFRRHIYHLQIGKLWCGIVPLDY